MKAILIDAENSEVKEVSYNGDYREICKLIKADCFTVGAYLENGDTIFVDDEGLLKDPEYFFVVPEYPNPLAGNGLLLGVDKQGRSISAVSSLQEIKKKVRFEDINTVGLKVQMGLYR